MALGEFDLIEKYFTRGRTPGGDPAGTRDGLHGEAAVELGIGDDCALLRTTPGMRLAVSSDMLVEGRHFLSTVDPARLGHKALAVNLSDLAACGAKPLAFTLALSMPRVDETFLAGFAGGMFALADKHGCELMGGDTTQGPLNICITVMGEVPIDKALLRSGARAGDLVWVSGTLGDARLALEAFRGTHRLTGHDFDEVRSAMEQPEPRVRLGIALRGLATSAIDVSDGFLGDLRHILERSHVGARIDIDSLPRSAVLAAQPVELQRLCTMSGGDDYELVFTSKAVDRASVLSAGADAGVALACVGRIEAEPGVRVVDAGGHAVAGGFASFDHFRE